MGEKLGPTRRDSLKTGGALGIFAAMSAACARREGKPVSSAVDGDDGVALAARIKAGETTATAAVEAAIARAEAADPQINAIVTRTFARARADAASAETGSFMGVPTFVKDLVDVAGVPTENGSNAFAGYTPDAQPLFVDDLMAAGFVSLGKSATPEFGLTATTEPVRSGATRNPWNLDYSTGGSSGGAAALVASGVVPLAHASDGGGSIRIPASCCGLVGLKPSRDRYRPVRDESATPVRLSVQGVETRSVRDTAAFLAAMEWREGPLTPVGFVTGPSEKRLKIGYFTAAPAGAPVDGDVVSVIEETAGLCERLGHQVSAFGGVIDPGLGDDFLLYWKSLANALVNNWENATGLTASEETFEPFTLGLSEAFLAEQAGIQSSIFKLIGYGQTYGGYFEDVDVILSPVLTTPPPEIGFLSTTLDYETAIDRIYNYAQYTSPANIAGAPAISLPLGMSSAGLPIGAQFQAAMGGEAALLGLAYELEAAAPWAERKPPLYLG